MKFATVKTGPHAGELVRQTVNPSINLLERPLPHHVRGLSYTATGYGEKIPTRYMVRVYDQKWRRVYARCFSNVATLYIVHEGEKHVISW